MPNAFLYNLDGEKTLFPAGQLTEHFYKKEFDCKCGCGTGQINKVLSGNRHLLEENLGLEAAFSGVECCDWVAHGDSRIGVYRCPLSCEGPDREH